MRTSFIAFRDLLFSEKGSLSKTRLRIGITAPTIITQTSSGVALDEGSAVCAITFDGLGVADIEIHGADGLQALALASNVDNYLRGLTKKFDFYWPNGDSYFDDDSA